MLVSLWIYKSRSNNRVTISSNSREVKQLDEITTNPDRFLGQEVTVQGEVGSVLGLNTIVLDLPGSMLNDDILVISTDQIGDSVESVQTYLDDKNVQLTGTVNRFIYATYKETLDLNIQPGIVSVYEGRPFILVDSISLGETKN